MQLPAFVRVDGFVMICIVLHIALLQNAIPKKQNSIKNHTTLDEKLWIASKNEEMQCPKKRHAQPLHMLCKINLKKHRFSKCRVVL
jgi:hypothetical protein